MVGKRLVVLVVISIASLAIAFPASASAAGTNFAITIPAPNSVQNSIPSSPSWSVNAGFAFQSVPTCSYDAVSPAACNGAHSKPTTQGMHTLTVAGTIVTSPGGVEVGPDSDTISFEYDTTDPIVTFNSPANAAHLAQKRPVFDFTVTDDPTGSFGVTCSIDGNSEDCTSSLPYQPATDLAEGGHSLQVVVEDGVNATVVNRTFIVDTIAPVISVIYPTPGVTVDSAVPEVNLSIEGATAGSFCKFDDQPYQSCGASWLGGSLADGAHTLHVRGIDIAGNVSEVAVSFFVDDTLGATPVPYETSITGGRGGKIKRGKFKVKAGFSLLGPEGSSAAVLCAAKVKATLKPKGGRTYTDRIQMMNRNGRCVASTTFTLPRRFKGKRAKLTFRYPGTAALGVLSRSKTIKKL